MGPARMCAYVGVVKTRTSVNLNFLLPGFVRENSSAEFARNLARANINLRTAKIVEWFKDNREGGCFLCSCHHRGAEIWYTKSASIKKL